MKTISMKLFVLLLFYDCVTSLIIPEELPSILSVVYSNIPPIKKGTDSRVGLGFRLGEHADFQILLEIGPQKETEPIGNTESKRRRMVTYQAAMRGDLGPWAQSVAKYQTQMKLQHELQKLKQLQEKAAKIKSENGDKVENKKISSNDWLTKWSKGLASSENKIRLEPIKTITLNVKNDKRIESRIDQVNSSDKNNIQSQISELEKLFKKQETS